MNSFQALHTLDFEQQLLLQHQVDQLNSRYAAVLDQARFDEWPELFLESSVYMVQARENHQRGLPLALIRLESKGMMKDRIYGATQTIYHAPYYMRHLISRADIEGIQGQGDGQVIFAQANYAVFRTKPAGISEVFSAGRYIDEIERTSEGLRFKKRSCIYDSELILNSLIYPI